jgi:hypothetical protein
LPTPGQCLTQTIITDNTRNANYIGSSSGCDSASTLGAVGWYQFTGAAGTILANYPVPIGSCGTQYTGWYNGTYPSLPNSLGSGSICFNGPSNNCYTSITTLITNCNGYYTFLLFAAPTCNLRYCTM